MALLDPNLPIFDRLPQAFASPFPSTDALLSPKFAALMERVSDPQKLLTVGQQLLAQAQATAWRDGLALVNAAKAQLVGDFLTDWMPKVAWMEPIAGSLAPVARGLWAAVSFAQSADPKELALSIAKVALDVALGAISAVPIVGQVLGFVVGIAKFLFQLFTSKEPEPQKALLLPWEEYSRQTDEDLVQLHLNKIFGASRDWTDIWMPPTELRPWQLNGAVRDGKEFEGEVFAPLHGDVIPFSSGLGCIPGTLRVAGHLQRLPGKATSEALRRFFLDDVQGMGWGGVVTNTGDFFPSTGQVAGGLWQQVQRRGSPDMFKVDASRVLSAWTDYFGLLFERVWQLQATKPWASEFLAPYICVKRGAGSGWSLGIPNLQRPHPAPFITANILQGRGPGTPETWIDCLWVEEDTPKRTSDWPYGGEPRQHPDHGLRAQRYQNFKGESKWGDQFYYAQQRTSSALPPGMTVPPGYRCVRWPSAEELLSHYSEPVEAIIRPACERLAELQKESLERTLVCAYVNEKYSAFLPDKGQRLREMREKLLVSKARMAVNLEDVRDIDPDFAQALQASGVPVTRAQRAAALRELAAAGGDPAEKPTTKAPPPPIEIQGGVPFDDSGPPPAPEVAASSLGPVAIGMATLGAVGAGFWLLRRHRRPVPDVRPWLG